MVKLKIASSHKRQRIVKTLICEIKPGVWPGGDRLPAEREQAKRFNCTRTTLRTELTLLEKQNDH